MENFSDYIGLIVILGAIVISVTRGNNKKKKEETARTMLPGRKAGEVLKPKPVKQTKPEQPSMTTIFASRKKETVSSLYVPEKEVEQPIHIEEYEDPLLNVRDLEEVKRAVVYSEILRRWEE
ncbi:MAG: hypothetical protein LBN18_03960 [Dysgonamonadaceae bacterium]|jgi:sortase (surface protein transpeptidase)|nr:hypothetical protein [Dysgonamonadaceae bacterium]